MAIDALIEKYDAKIDYQIQPEGKKTVIYVPGFGSIGRSARKQKGLFTG